MQKCQHIVIPSESIKEILVKNYGLEERYTVIPTGTNLEPYRCADWKSLRKEKGWQDETVLISVGRLAPEKNWDTLLHAFAKVCQQRSGLRLVLIGDGPARATLESLAAELGITERVAFTGSLPFEEVPCYLKSADMFTFASVTETQGLVTIEAMAAGLPIVAVDGSGTRDIVEHGKQGLLVENDAEALAQGIETLLSNPERLKRFKANSLKKSRIFDVNQLGKQLVSVYEQAIQDKKENRYVTLKAEESGGQEVTSPAQE
jgi:glycosyltransferase involved in cell wall biosynthesis